MQHKPNAIGSWEKLEEAGRVLYGISEATSPTVGVCLNRVTQRLHML